MKTISFNLHPIVECVKRFDDDKKEWGIQERGLSICSMETELLKFLGF